MLRNRAALAAAGAMWARDGPSVVVCEARRGREPGAGAVRAAPVAGAAALTRAATMQRARRVRRRLLDPASPVGRADPRPAPRAVMARVLRAAAQPAEWAARPQGVREQGRRGALRPRGVVRDPAGARAGVPTEPAVRAMRGAVCRVLTVEGPIAVAAFAVGRLARNEGVAPVAAAPGPAQAGGFRVKAPGRPGVAEPGAAAAGP